MSHFQAFSPSYENISNRVSRLRYSSQNHYKTYAPSQSPPKSIALFATETQPVHYLRPTPSALNLCEETLTTGRFTGRVTKNTGLKKYNQRQIKEVMTNNKEPLQETNSAWTQSQERKARFQTEGNNFRELADVSNHNKKVVDTVKVSS